MTMFFIFTESIGSFHCFYFVLSFECRLDPWGSIKLIFIYSWCHNPIFTPEIFSGVGMQNEAAQIEPTWPDKCPPHQNNLKTGSEAYFPKSDQVWPCLTGVDQVWPRFDQTVFDPTGVHYTQKPSKCGPGYISQNSESFNQVWPELTKFDWGLTKLFLTWLGSTIPKNSQNVVRDTFPRVRRALTKFDQVWPRFDRTVNQTENWIRLTNPWLMCRACQELQFDTLRVKNGRETRELWTKLRKTI